MLDISGIITTAVSSGIISVAAVNWLGKSLITHQFDKELKRYQADLDRTTNASKSEMEAFLRAQTEEYIGEKAAERQYVFDARRRLYTAVGPFRFQLALACRDFLKRLSGGSPRYSTNIRGYYGLSTAYRMLRLFGITELIERQVSAADFTVDPSTVVLLRFKLAAFRCMTSRHTSLGHPGENWDDQCEHVFYDTLSLLGATMVVDESNGKLARLMRFDEFTRFIQDEDKLTTLEPIPALFDEFTPAKKPILWIRLVALCQLCHAFLAQEASSFGIDLPDFDGLALLRESSDEFVQCNIDQYCEMLRRTNASLLPKKEIDTSLPTNA
jgi:hypothetical protein